MENQIPENPYPQDSLEYWDNELAYLEKAMEGLRYSYSITAALHAQASEKRNALIPDRDAVGVTLESNEEWNKLYK